MLFAIPGLLKIIHVRLQYLVSLANLIRDHHHQLTKGDAFFSRHTGMESNVT
jgi:hypothetical protein